MFLFILIISIIFFIVYVVFPDLSLSQRDREIYFQIREKKFFEIKQNKSDNVRAYISEDRKLKIIHVSRDIDNSLSKSIIVFNEKWDRITSFIFDSQIRRIKRNLKQWEYSKYSNSINFWNEFSMFNLLFKWFTCERQN